MDLHFLPRLSLPSLAHDVLVVAGAGAALLASVVVINVGLLLPGLLTALGEPRADQRGEFVARPLLWRHLSGCAATSLAPPGLTGKR